MTIGFTGTSEGMTEKQRDTVEAQLAMLRVSGRQFHHGDCIGADLQAAQIAMRLVYYVHCHPPIIEAKRAFGPADTTYAAKSYMARNQDIVDACEILLAAPRTMHEELRSGTWATVRRARKAGKVIIIVWPNGSVTTNE